MLSFSVQKFKISGNKIHLFLFMVSVYYVLLKDLFMSQIV